MWIYGGGIEKAYIITPEEAVKAVEVAKAMPVKRSIKAIPNNILLFLAILDKILIAIVLLYTISISYSRRYYV